MGCGMSRLDKEEEMPAGLRPFRSRIEEMKRRRRRARNLSIVSTAELLRAQEGYDDVAVVEEEEEKMKVISEEDTRQEVIAEETEEDVDQGKERALEEEEELPGSPSFRIYFKDTSTRESDDDSVKIIQRIKNEKLKGKVKAINTSSEKQREMNSHGRKSSNESLNSNTSGEESHTKSLKKERGRRFKALTKAPSRVYSFLTVRNCYSPGCAGTTTHANTRLMAEKAT